MNAQHTRGPWLVLPEESDRDYIRIRGTALGARFKIANVLMPTYAGSDRIEVAETIANARLIGAAPALLPVAQMVANLGEYRELVDAMARVLRPHERAAFIRLFREDARAAFAAATGRTS